MYGEDSSGRRVSLLNDTAVASSRTLSTTTSTSTSTSALKSSSSSSSTSTFSRPQLPDRSRFSHSDSSTCSSRSRDSFRSSRPSSVSCSPRRTPPTPPLLRLDSGSSTSTQSPMTPPFHYDPMDPRTTGFNKGHKDNQSDYYGHAYPPQPHHHQQQQPPPQHQHHQQQQQHVVPATTPFPPMANGSTSSFYSMADPQIVPSGFDMTNPYAVSNAVHPGQQLLQYASNPAMSPISPRAASMLSSPTAMMPAAMAGVTINPLRDVNIPPIATPNASAYHSQLISPTKTEPPTPTTANTSTGPDKAATSGAGVNSKDPNQPKKKYACPHAKTAGCKDTFTTSGHAARHGKKHTGEKNVVCPTCHKTFTRKDNMKQHEKTHKAGSNSANARPSGDASNAGGAVTSSTNPRRTRAVSSSTVGSMSSQKDGDGADVIMSDAPAHPGMLAAAAPPRPQMRSQLSEILEQVKQDSDMDADGELDGDEQSPALDALASVAAGEFVQ